MATNNSLKNQLVEKGQNPVDVQETMFKNLINSDDVKLKFTEVLKDKAPEFIDSIINLVNGDKYIGETHTPDVVGVSNLNKSQAFGSLLKECEPMSVIDACMIAAVLDLSIDKNLDYMGLENLFIGVRKILRRIRRVFLNQIIDGRLIIRLWLRKW